MALWFFNKVLWFVLAAMLEGILLRSNMAAKTSFCLYLVNRLIVALKCAVNVTTSSFQYFPWSFKCKICVQKEVIHNFWKSHFGHVTSYELTNFKKMVRVWKTKSLLFCLRYDPLIVFRRQSHITFTFIKAMSPLCANGLLRETPKQTTSSLDRWRRELKPGSYMQLMYLQRSPRYHLGYFPDE